MAILSLLASILGVIAFASAAVLPRQGAVNPLSQDQIAAFDTFTFFASASYCSPDTTIDWTCGANCDANSGFTPIASGGDGTDNQFWYAGYDSVLDAIVVSHQGTDPSKIIPLLTDGDFFLEPLDPSLFPGTSNLKVHSGFQAAHARSANDVLAAVENGLATYSTTTVVLVGHSLGAAIALLNAVYLPLHLSSSTTLKYVGYGVPRVGNEQFAAYVDANIQDLTRINNKEDPVPTLPGKFLGFHHPHGEIHIQSWTLRIQDSSEWDSCDGDDNTSTLCSTGDVPNIFYGNLDDHDGPYDGITMGC